MRGSSRIFKTDLGHLGCDFSNALFLVSCNCFLPGGGGGGGLKGSQE